MLNSAEQEVKTALEAFLEATRTGDGVSLSRSMDRLDQFAAGQEAGLSPRLKHFLERRSYAKALAFLEGEDSVPRGRCGGKEGV